MTIASAQAEIRRSRQLKFVGADPYTWEALSTDGSYRHTVVWEEGRERLVCLTCEAKHGRGECWVVKRAADWLAMKYGGTVQHGPDVDEEKDPNLDEHGKYRAVSWREVFAEAKRSA